MNKQNKSFEESIENNRSADALDQKVEESAVFMRKAIYSIILLVVLLLVWAFFTKIDNYAKAKGEAVPMGRVQSIQSLKGGRIDDILVREGDTVTKGQILIRFDKKTVSSKTEKLELEVLDLEVEAEILHAFVEERAPNLSYIKNINQPIVDKHQAASRAKQNEMDAELSILEKDLAEAKSQLSKIQREIPALQEQLSTSLQVLVMYQTMAEKNIGSKKQVLEQKQTRANIKKEYQSLLGERKTLKIKIESFPLRVDKVKKHYFSGSLALRVKVLSQLREIKEKLAESKNTLGHRNVISPIEGIIKSIPQRSLGSVIAPGGVIAEIVPIEGDIIVEVKIQPKDIGFIKKRQKAILRFDAYEYSQYGVVYGEVLSISPTTFIDRAKHIVYYKVRVKPANTYVGNNPKLNLIIPGMTLECDIVTDKKTVLQALIKPIYNAVHTAFRGR